MKNRGSGTCAANSLDLAESARGRRYFPSSDESSTGPRRFGLRRYQARGLHFSAAIQPAVPYSQIFKQKGLAHRSSDVQSKAEMPVGKMSSSTVGSCIEKLVKSVSRGSEKERLRSSRVRCLSVSGEVRPQQFPTVHIVLAPSKAAFGFFFDVQYTRKEIQLQEYPEAAPRT